MRVGLVQVALPAYRLPLFRSLAASPGVDLTVLVSDRELPGRPLSVDAADLDVQRLRWRTVGPLLSCPGLLQTAAIGFDALVLPWNVRIVELAPALAVARQGGTRTVLWGQGRSKGDRTLLDPLRLRIARQADAVVVYSFTVGGQLRPQLGDRLYVAPNGVDETAIEAASRGRSVEDDGVFRVLFVGRLDRRKQVGLLIDAMKGVQAPWELSIVGDGEELDALKAQAAALPVRFAGARWSEEELAPFFEAADVAVIPGAAGLGALHAMAWGVPFVTSDDRSRHAPELECLVDGSTGRLFRADDPSDLLRVLDELRASPEERSALAKTARDEVVHGPYSASATVRGLLAAITGEVPPNS